MSLLVLAINKDYITMGADSRESKEINGTKIALNDNCEKVRHIGNRVYFGAGNRQLMEIVMKEVSKQTNPTIQDIQAIARHYSNLYIEQFGKDYVDKNYFHEDCLNLLGLVVSEYVDDTPTAYALHSMDDYAIQVIAHNTDNTQTYTLGASKDEAGKILRSRNWSNIYDLYRNVFGGVASEEIGGNLTMYQISKTGIIQLLQERIPDKEYINYINGNAVMTGNITMLGGEIKWDEVNKPTAQQVGALPSDTPIPVLPSYIKSTKITATTIESPTITGATINGGTINVETDINVGQCVVLNDGSGGTTAKMGTAYLNLGNGVEKVFFLTESATINNTNHTVTSINYIDRFVIFATDIDIAGHLNLLAGKNLSMSNANIDLNTGVDLLGDWNFSGANVTGLNFQVKFA